MPFPGPFQIWLAHSCLCDPADVIAMPVVRWAVVACVVGLWSPASAFAPTSWVSSSLVNARAPPVASALVNARTPAEQSNGLRLATLLGSHITGGTKSNQPL